jgi:CRISPR-associated protein Csb2
VNEGVPEWPPSPWRLLRALVAVWKRTCPDLSEAQVQRVLMALVQPPRFQLPPHRVAHTRHYMPWEKKGPTDRTLVFDTFVSVSRRASVFIAWPEAELSTEDRLVLARLLGNLSSLGRAEGWVQAELHDSAVGDLPIGPAEESDSNPVPVFCPDPDSAFGDEHYPRHDPKKLAKGKVDPADFLFDCPRWHLCLDTETIHSQMWPTVPGGKWVNYTRPSETGRVARSKRSPPRQHPTIARFLLDGPVLPHITQTVGVAEEFRHQLLRSFSRVHGGGRRSEILSGKDAAGQPLQMHGHAHFLPTAEGDDLRRIAHVTVFARGGLCPEDVAALSALRDLQLPAGGDRVLRLRVQLVGLGTQELFRGTVDLFRSATVWESATPFVVHRHLKRRGTRKDTPHLEGLDPAAEFVDLAVRELISRRQLGTLVGVERLKELPCQVRAAEFERRRRRTEDDGGHRPFGAFRLTFADPVEGPLCLGYGGHYGLGLFLPELEPSTAPLPAAPQVTRVENDLHRS